MYFACIIGLWLWSTLNALNAKDVRTALVIQVNLVSLLAIAVASVAYINTEISKHAESYLFLTSKMITYDN